MKNLDVKENVPKNTHVALRVVYLMYLSVSLVIF